MSGYEILGQITATVLVALISVVFSGILLESYKRHRDLQGVASALAGEIFSIIHISQKREHARQFALLLANLEAGQIVNWPDITGGDPSQNDPVVKSQAERIGLLPNNIPERIATFYHHMRGIRIDIVNLSKGVFKEPKIQAAIIRADLMMWDDAVRIGNDLWRDLRNISTEHWWLKSAILRTKERIHRTALAVTSRATTLVRKMLGLAKQYSGVDTHSLPPQPSMSNASAYLAEALPIVPNSADRFEAPFKELAAEIATYIDTTMLPSILPAFDANKERALKHLLIDFQSAVYLERASRFMFGSQIDALIYLGANNSRGTREEISRFYLAATQVHPDTYARYSFEGWLGFLQSNELVKMDGDVISLLPGGKAVTGYMKTRGYLTTRPQG
ncbi:MAG: hypothetical protein ABSC06_18850 [Rhodopila sp.]